jgi:hypothetical protein
MYYEFTATSGSYTDKIAYTVIVRDPYFYLKKTGVTLTLGGSSAGRNLLTNKAVSATDANSIIAIDGGSLILHGGINWLSGVRKIEFVPSTLEMYSKNNTSDAISAFELGARNPTANPIEGGGVYIFKITNGSLPSDEIFGMIKITNVVPGVSVTFEYRIGNMYAHLTVIS